MKICIYIIYESVCVYIYVHIFLYIRIRTYTYMHIHMYAYMYVFFMNVCMHIYIYLCRYVCTYVVPPPGLDLQLRNLPAGLFWRPPLSEVRGLGGSQQLQVMESAPTVRTEQYLAGQDKQLLVCRYADSADFHREVHYVPERPKPCPSRQPKIMLFWAAWRRNT